MRQTVARLIKSKTNNATRNLGAAMATPAFDYNPNIVPGVQPFTSEYSRVHEGVPFIEYANSAANPIYPTFWTGKPAVDAGRFTVDCSKFNMELGPKHKENRELVKTIHKTFDDVGLAFLVNTGLAGDLKSLQDWGMLYTKKGEDYEGGANDRSSHFENVYDTGAPMKAHICYHHEMAYINVSVKTVTFFMIKGVNDPTDPLRGCGFLSEQIGCTQELLKTELGQKLKEKGVCYIRCLTDREENVETGVYNTWQQSFLTEDPKIAEAKAAKYGLTSEWGPCRYLKTKHYTGAYEYFPKMDKNILYSSIADHSSWFDTWPKVMDLDTMKHHDVATHMERPLAMTFGDDTPFTQDELETFSQVYDHHGFPVPFADGDIALVCNYRFAHGRPTIPLADHETRHLGVIFGDKYKRLGQYNDKEFV